MKTASRIADPSGRRPQDGAQPEPKVQCALYAPTAAIVSPWEFAIALAETAVRNKG